MKVNEKLSMEDEWKTVLEFERGKWNTPNISNEFWLSIVFRNKPNFGPEFHMRKTNIGN